ncbi:uncharacterized protein LOC130446353 isoform X2 [Diorhabda sublineata]|nr:uncharacterized protein LOC130446353 isoform X2 [Diorhabda sublineata]XP_056638537.1 uncharacterized protein LOC130446353 isoform X2 [Diorhabda sublineata]XP_056638539.1 uncharacterized protein LOC130446353 isoform X2 [Diorhabda sublineata]XP_056638540.1 uncharacterized protein LOC130446353 isoform X2 [Diorhabda sublineata]XP_056638541.1 uncharacterized protein LOC130446353 isoform X2 [Diorhabda sublineata]XP_056638542.1 uncharacterized protein LOC130446353 isoform X2 [Diorhabda sublineata]
MDSQRKISNVPSPPKNTSSNSNQQGFATLIVMIAVLFIIVLFCCFAAPGIRMMCKRYIFRRCLPNDHNIDNGSTRTDEVCTPTVIILPNGRMLVVDRNVLRTELELMEISADLFNPHVGSTPSILDSSDTSKGISPTSLGVPPPTYEDVFPDFPPSYSEISIVQKSDEFEDSKERKLSEDVVNCNGLINQNVNCE